MLAPLEQHGVSMNRGKAILRGDARQVPLGPLFPSLDSVEWGIGADTVWHGFRPCSS